MNIETSMLLNAGGPGSGRKSKGELPKINVAVRTDPRQTSLYGPEHTKELQDYYKKKVKAGFVTDLRDKMTMFVNQNTGEIKPPMKAGEENIEREGFSVNKKGRTIKQVGTQFCVEGEENLGCYPSMEQAEAVKQGKSFIEPLMKAGGPGSGRRKEAYDLDERSAAKLLSKLGYTVSSSKGVSRGFPVYRYKHPEGHTAKTTYAGRLHLRAPEEHHQKIAKFIQERNYRKSDKDYMQQTGRLPAGGHSDRSAKVREEFLRKNKDKGIKAEMTEPNAGALSSTHMDTRLFFHPPSLKNPDHIPNDGPRETNDRFLDVTKRKEAHQDRMKILKRSTPGGTPPLIPARTTLLSPHMANFTPGMLASSKRKPGKRQRMFRAFNAASI